MWVTTAGNVETFIQAGKLGANLLTHLLGQTVEEVAEKVRAYRKAWTEAGHPGRGTVTLMLAHVRRAGRGTVESGRAPADEGLPEERDVPRQGGRLAVPDVQEDVGRAGEDARRVLRDDLARGHGWLARVRVPALLSGRAACSARRRRASRWWSRVERRRSRRDRLPDRLRHRYRTSCSSTCPISTNCASARADRAARGAAATSDFSLAVRLFERHASRTSSARPRWRRCSPPIRSGATGPRGSAAHDGGRRGVSARAGAQPAGDRSWAAHEHVRADRDDDLVLGWQRERRAGVSRRTMSPSAGRLSNQTIYMLDDRTSSRCLPD